MPTLVSKLKGTLHLGDVATGVDMSAQVTAVGVPQTVTRDAAVTVLTGDVIQASATYSWSLTGSALLDFLDPDGAYAYVWNHQGEQLPFEFMPAEGGPTYAGTVVNDGWSTEELNSGAMIVSKFAWPVQGQVTITWPTRDARDARDAADA